MHPPFLPWFEKGSNFLWRPSTPVFALGVFAILEPMMPPVQIFPQGPFCILGVVILLIIWFVASDSRHVNAAKRDLTETVSSSVREGMDEKARKEAFMSVELMKYKVAQYSADGQGNKALALTGYAMTDEECATIIREQNEATHAEFDRHVWTELRTLVYDLRRFDFVKIDPGLMSVSRSGFLESGLTSPIGITFAALDDLSRQLLYPVK